LAAFAIEEILQVPFVYEQIWKNVPAEKRADSASVLNSILTSNILSPLDQWIVKNRGKDDGPEFNIPVELEASQNMNRMMAALWGWVFKVSRQFFSPDSWPSIVAREAVFIQSGKT